MAAAFRGQERKLNEADQSHRWPFDPSVGRGSWMPDLARSCQLDGAVMSKSFRLPERRLKGAATSNFYGRQWLRSLCTRRARERIPFSRGL